MQIQNAILTGSTTVYGPITFVSGTLAGSASYAATSSYADTFTVAGSLTAQTLVVQTITSSVSFITGSTRFGSLLTNTHIFTGSIFLTGSAINVNNSKAIIGDDVSYGAAYQTLAFGSATNGFNRISGHSSTNDGLYFMAATGRGFVFRPNGSTIGNFIISSIGRVGIGTNLSSPSALLHISGSGSDPLMQISSTVSSSIFFVSGSGNVGIGTTTPAYRLTITGPTASLHAALTTNGEIARFSAPNGFSGSIFLGRPDVSSEGLTLTYDSTNGNSIQNTIVGSHIIQTANVERMRVTSAGNVGIGTTSPNGRFEVATGSAGVTVGDFLVDTTNKYVYVGRQSSTSGDNTTFVVRDRTGTARATIPGGGSLDTIFTTNASNFNVTNYGGTSLFFVSGSGNVGIGTASPSQVLHISNASNYVGALINGSNAPQLCFAQGSGTSPNWKVGISGNDGNAFSISSGSINADKLVILRNGNVGIGTFAPAYSLSVQSGWIHNYGAQNASGFRYENDASGHVLNMNANNSYAQLYTGTTTALYFGSNNILSLGINTSGHVIAITDNTYTMGASGNRWSAIWSANGTIQTSDEREKKDITNTDLGLDFVSKLRPVCYKWKVGQNIVTREPDGLDENGNEQFKIVKTPREGTRVHYGLIAQEVKQVLGDKDFGGYIHDEDTDIKGLRYDQFIAPLIKAIQELSTKLEEATTRIKTLESK